MKEYPTTGMVFNHAALFFASFAQFTSLFSRTRGPVRHAVPRLPPVSRPII